MSSSHFPINGFFLRTTGKLGANEPLDRHQLANKPYRISSIHSHLIHIHCILCSILLLSLHIFRSITSSLILCISSIHLTLLTALYSSVIIVTLLDYLININLLSIEFITLLIHSLCLSIYPIYFCYVSSSYDFQLICRYSYLYSHSVTSLFHSSLLISLYDLYVFHSTS